MYDSVIIGAGPAGYVAAIKMSHLGLKVAVAEKEHAGGTCSNKGCIPTKALLYSSELYDKLKRKGNTLGIISKGLNFDFEKIRRHMMKAISTSRKGVEFLFKKNKIDYIKEEAIVKKAGVVKVGDSEIQTRNILIATGSIPTLFPPFNEIPGIWTSDDVFTMERLPESILIVGGGVIGVEMASFFAMLGVKTYIVEIMEHIIPTEDKDVANILKKSLISLGINIFESSKVVSIDKIDEKFKVSIETSKENIEVDVEKILVSVGRKPNIQEFMEKIGIKIEKGIVTDDNLRTNVEGIYAAGDVRGKIMLAHVGFHEGITAAYNIKGESRKVDLSVVPYAIYTYPEIGAVGMKEKDMNMERHAIAKFPVMANGRATAMGEREGFAKVVYEKQSGKVLGLTIIGPFASELIMEGTVAIKHGIIVEKLVNTIHPHPTISEVLLGAFEEAEGKAIHI